MSYIGNEEVVVASGDGSSGARGGGNNQELRIKWTDTSIARLCNAIKQFPHMYDLDHPQHKDRALKKRSWVAIAKTTGIVSDPRKVLMFARECERKFKNLRDELIKTLKRTRARKTDRPYKHADLLAFLRLERLLDMEPTYYEGDNETADHDYDNTDTMDTHAIEAAYAAAQVANDSAIQYSDNYEESHATGPRIASVRANYSSPKRSHSSRNESSHPRDVHYPMSALYEALNETRQRKNFSSPTMVRIADSKETDELEDFSSIMVKRLRRLPNECWGQAMSRLMETLSSVEENAKKGAVLSSYCQTDF